MQEVAAKREFSSRRNPEAIAQFVTVENLRKIAIRKKLSNSFSTLSEIGHSLQAGVPNFVFDTQAGG